MCYRKGKGHGRHGKQYERDENPIKGIKLHMGQGGTRSTHSEPGWRSTLSRGRPYVGGYYSRADFIEYIGYDAGHHLVHITNKSRIYIEYLTVYTLLISPCSLDLPRSISSFPALPLTAAP